MADTFLNEAGVTTLWSKIKGYAATLSHVHGNITNTGDITTTATIASGDRLVINDESDSKIVNSSITFGTSTSTYLRNDGTWGTPTDTDTITTYYGTSSAGATSANKTVTCSGYSLVTGNYIAITFSEGNTVTASTVQLSVNSTTYKPIYVNNASTSTTNYLFWDADDTLLFVYDGTGYQFIARQSANIPMTDDEIYAAVSAGWGGIPDADTTSY